MKYQIRQGVFETNSSSTHCLQLLHKDSECLLEIINKHSEPEKVNNHIYRSDEFENTEKWIENGVLRLNHMNLIYSDYSKSYHYIFKTLISRVDFIGMLYFGSAKKFFDIKNLTKEEIIDKMKNLPLFEDLNKEIIKAFKKRGYSINSIEWNVKKFISLYQYHYNDKSSNLFSKKDIDVNEFLKVFKRVLKEEYSISFSDEAYFEFRKITYII